MQVSALTEDLMQPTERICSQMQPNHLGMPADSSAKTEPLIQVNDSLLWARETGFPIGSHPVSRQCILPLWKIITSSMICPHPDLQRFEPSDGFHISLGRLRIDRSRPFGETPVQ